MFESGAIVISATDESGDIPSDTDDLFFDEHGEMTPSDGSNLNEASVMQLEIGSDEEFWDVTSENRGFIHSDEFFRKILLDFLSD